MGIFFKVDKLVNHMKVSGQMEYPYPNLIDSLAELHVLSRLC